MGVFALLSASPTSLEPPRLETTTVLLCSVPGPRTVSGTQQQLSEEQGVVPPPAGGRPRSFLPCPSMGVGGFPQTGLLGSCGWEVKARQAQVPGAERELVLLQRAVAHGAGRGRSAEEELGSPGWLLLTPAWATCQPPTPWMNPRRGVRGWL